MYLATPCRSCSRSLNGWMLTPGSQVNVIEWAGLRMAIVICVDTEVSGLWARLALLDLDLILVPVKTERISGFNRVFGCARARAIELQTVVCAVGDIGKVMGFPGSDPVVGGAAAFLPCDAGLNTMGAAAALEPHVPASGMDPVLYAANLPVGYCRQIRHGAAEAEVWPGSWAVEHITAADLAVVS